MTRRNQLSPASVRSLKKIIAHAKAAKNRKDGESVREWTPHGGSFSNRFETPKRDRPDAGSTG